MNGNFLMMLLRQKGLNVPVNMCNDPNAIIQYLLNSGQITQQQYNAAVMQAQQFKR